MESAQKHAVLIAGDFIRKITASAFVPRPVMAAMAERRAGTLRCLLMAQPGFIIVEENVVVLRVPPHAVFAAGRAPYPR